MNFGSLLSTYTNYLQCFIAYRVFIGKYYHVLSCLLKHEALCYGVPFDNHHVFKQRRFIADKM